MTDSTTKPFSMLFLGSADFENPRLDSGLDAESIQELADDIATRGLLYPLLIWLTPEGEHVILGGQRRYRAIERLIEEGRAGELEAAVPVILYEAQDIEEARAVALADGLHRKQLSSYEIAQALSKMSGSQKEIAQRIGKSESYVTRALQTIRSAGPALQVAWRDGQVSFSKAQQIAEMPPRMQGSAVGLFISEPRRASITSSDGLPMRKPKREGDGRPGIGVIKKIVNFAKRSKPSNHYEKGLIDMARFVVTGEAPDDDRWRNYLEE